MRRLAPKVIRAVGKALPEQTITTEPERFKEAFLGMVREYIRIPGVREDGVGDAAGEGEGSGAYKRICMMA